MGIGHYFHESLSCIVKINAISLALLLHRTKEFVNNVRIIDYRQKFS